MTRSFASTSIGFLLVVASSFAASAASPETAAGTRVEALEALVEQALVSSPRLEREDATAAGAEAGARIARSGLLPRLAFEQRFTSTDQPTAAFGAALEQGRIDPGRFASLSEPDRVENWSTRLMAGMTVFDFGRSWNAWSAAASGASRARLELEDVRRQVRFDVASAFFGLLRARAEHRVFADTVRALEARRDAVRARVDVGETLRADLLAVEVRRGEAEEGRLTSRHEVELARAGLAAVVGVPYEDVGDPATALRTPVYDVALDRVLELSASNPRITALERAVTGAEAALRAARLASLPRLRGEVAGHWNGDDETFGLDRESYLAGVVMELPIFEGGRLAAERGAAEARVREARAALREVEIAITVAARRADRSAREAISRVALADRAAEAATEALEVFSARYDQGMVPLETLLEMERDRSRARARGVEARAAASIAVEAVRRLAGEEALR